MLEIVKTKIWDLLKGKNISLAMIYHRQGQILWHKGREIEGKDIFSGYGFCKSYISESLSSSEPIDIEDSMKTWSGDLSRSAETLLVKSVIIYPIARDFFLYVDSGKRESFTERERISFGILGELLEQGIVRVSEEVGASDLSGASKAMGTIREQVVRYSLEEEPVLLSGETGVGKNRVAGLIHRYSGRKGKFIVVDTPNIQDNLFESKLFGHKKGAFTDAQFSKRGLVQEAEGGTLFFDEITEVPLEVQAKLLRFLDTRRYYVLGESEEREADVRLIAATNKALEQAVSDKEFRQDLYYRLNVLEIIIPPLRERGGDIKALVLENLDLLRGKEIGEGFWEVVSRYEWPGNVRELINFLKRVGIMLDSPLSGDKVVALLPSRVAAGGVVAGVEDSRVDIGGPNIEGICEKINEGGSFWEAVWRPFIDRDIDRGVVKEVLKKYYVEGTHSFKRMIELLNVEAGDYQKFMSLLYKYRIDPRK
ncbi:MAG: sigma-54-dependent Fis family transcriptional regulator [bacterium]|nr:sigma-54-dependent Fis family transcriptional regulator [bacterium]